MPHQATVTAITGPGRSSVATPLTNISRVHLAFDERRVQIWQTGAGSPVREFELTNSTTVTITNSSGSYAVTIA